MTKQKASVRVPATTANLGPGFDCLGVAVRLYNTVSVSRGAGEPLPLLFRQIGQNFFRETGLRPFAFSVIVRGNVPRSRGLGSSVTVRLGLLAGLNELAGRPLGEADVLRLVIAWEGHPDNAVPAFYGGFAACAGNKFVTASVSTRLKFIALIPEISLETKAARRVLPKKVTLAEAVENLQNTALITAAFCQQHYKILPGLFQDRLHQPYRAHLMPCFQSVLAAAEKAGALGGFLSGSGSTLMAVALTEAEKIRAAMLKSAQREGVQAEALILRADNRGVVVR